jgi:dTDP-4-dehydrorhamnose reductase
VIVQKILLLGKNGQLGWALQRVLAPRGALVAHDRSTCDLADLDGLRAAVRAARPDVIVNAAAYTAVDRAEAEPELCHRINAEAPRVLAEEASRHGARLVHYSTDYVFDGAKAGCYTEDDAPNPLNVYGASKLKGEEAICAHDKRALILRVSWVYGLTGRNFARTMLRLAAEREELRVVADQLGTPTSVDLIAEITGRWIDRWQDGTTPADGGIYHLAPRGETSWHGFAVALVKEAQRCGWRLRARPETVMPIGTADYPVAAARPLNSRLSADKLLHALPLSLPEWQRDAVRFVREMDLARS